MDQERTKKLHDPYCPLFLSVEYKIYHSEAQATLKRQGAGKNCETRQRASQRKERVNGEDSGIGNIFAMIHATVCEFRKESSPDSRAPLASSQWSLVHLVRQAGTSFTIVGLESETEAR